MSVDRRRNGWLLALMFPLTVPLIFGVLMLPARLLTLAWGKDAPAFSKAIILGIGAAAVAGTIALHVRMWRTFMRVERQRSAEPR